MRPSPGNAARTTGVVDTSRVAAIIIRMSAAICRFRSLQRSGRGGARPRALSSALPTTASATPFGGAGAFGDRNGFDHPICKAVPPSPTGSPVVRGSRGRPAPGALVKGGQVCFHNAT